MRVNVAVLLFTVVFAATVCRAQHGSRPHNFETINIGLAAVVPIGEAYDGLWSIQPGLEGRIATELYGGTVQLALGVLEIHIPREDEPETDIHPDSLAVETEKIRQQMQEQGGLIRGFLGEARMSASIVFPGTITETNASYADSTTVTLVDILFGSMLDLMKENPEIAARLQLAQSESQRQALLAEMGELADFRYEANNDVVVRFE